MSRQPEFCDASREMSCPHASQNSHSAGQATQTKGLNADRFFTHLDTDFCVGASHDLPLLHPGGALPLEIAAQLNRSIAGRRSDLAEVRSRRAGVRQREERMVEEIQRLCLETQLPSFLDPDVFIQAHVE